MQRKKIKYFFGYPSREKEYILKLLLNFHGISSLITQNIEDADIIYDNKIVPGKINIIPNDKDIIWHELIDNNTTPNRNAEKFSFDILNSILCLLSDKINYDLPDNAYDRHKRLKFEDSWQAKNKLSKIPLVNIYCSFFSNFIKEKLEIQGKQYLPDGKKAIIILSHDVDRIYKYQILKNFKILSKWSLKEKAYHLTRYLHNKRKLLGDKRDEGYFVFDKITDFENSLGAKSTFFFCSNNGYSDWGSVFDVFYDIKWKEFRDIFGIIKSSGSEIGLHASYNSYKDYNRFVAEKEKLENASGTEVHGLRHHYWHTGKDLNSVFQKHDNAGFKYDSSAAFNENIGFRLNTALPYHPYDITNKKEMNLMEFPVLAMDGNFYYNENITQDEVLKTFSEYTDTLKKYNGVCAIDWHSEASYPSDKRFTRWAEGYREIVKMLTGDKEIWVTNHIEVYNYFKNREDKIISE